MARLHQALCGAAVVALVSGQQTVAQDASGGLRLTFGLTERLEVTDNRNYSSTQDGTLTSSATRLAFGLSSETRTQALSLSLAGNLRFEDGELADESGGLDDSSLALTYSRSAANSSFVFRASADQTLLSRAVPTAEDPDPNGDGSRLSHTVSATLALGVDAPIGLKIDALSSGAEYDGATEADSTTKSLTATGHLLLASGAKAEVTIGQTKFTEDDALSSTRETTNWSLGWTQPLSPSMTLDASVGQQSVDSFVMGTLDERTEGLTGSAGLSMALANGSAGLDVSQTNEPGARRQTVLVRREIDLARQKVALSLGLTRRAWQQPTTVGSLDWNYDGDVLDLSLGIKRTAASPDLDGEVITDRLAFGLGRDLGPNDRLKLDLSAVRIDDATLVDRFDLSASYSRDFGQDWQFNLGAQMTERREASESEQSKTIFLSITKNFELRP